MKRLAARAIGLGLRGRGAQRALLAAAGRARVPTVLCYHRIGGGPDWALPPERLAEHVAFLHGHFDIVTLQRLQRACVRGDPPRRPRLALTFDDGDASVYHQALPVLEALGLRATLFVCASTLRGAPLWTDAVYALCRHAPRPFLAAARGAFGAWADLTLAARLGEPAAAVEALKSRPAERVLALAEAAWDRLKARVPEADRPRYLTAAQLQELHGRGFEIGGHTLRHPILTRVPERVAATEVAEDKRRLEAVLGAPLTSFAYPNGDYSDAVRRLVRESGYACAVTVGAPRRGPLDWFALGRVYVSRGTAVGRGGRFSPGLFCAEVAGVWDRLRRA